MVGILMLFGKGVHIVSKGTRLLSSWFGCFGFASGFYFLGLCVFDSMFV